MTPEQSERLVKAAETQARSLSIIVSYLTTIRAVLISELATEAGKGDEDAMRIHKQLKNLGEI